MAGESPTSNTILTMYDVEFELTPWSTFAASHLFTINALAKKGYKWPDNTTMLQGDNVEITFTSHSGQPKLKYLIEKNKIATLDLFGVIRRLNMNSRFAQLYLQYHPEEKYVLSISNEAPNMLMLNMRLDTGEIIQFQFELDENGFCKIESSDERYPYFQHAIADGMLRLRAAVANHDPVAMAEQNAFHGAAIDGNYEKVKSLIEGGFDAHKAYFTRDVVKSLSNQLIKNILTLNNKGEKDLKLKVYLKKQYDLYLRYRNILKLLPNSHSQKWMISRLQTIYPSAEPKGICFAIAIMSTQALLANDIDTFNNRLDAMSRVPLKQFPAKLQDIQQRRIMIYREAKERCDVMTANGETPDINKISDDMMRQRWTEDDYYLRDISPFLDGIKAYQQSEKYLEVFPERRAYPIVRALEMMKLLSPVLMANIDNFSGIYKKHELTKHFQGLKIQLALHNTDFPIALRLSANNHAIMVGYDNVRKLWYLIDANQFPVTKVYRSEALLTQKVLHALFAKDTEAISTAVFVAAQHEVAATAAIAQWKATDEWLKTHTVTAERAKMKGDGGNRWIDMMHNDGNPETVTKLTEFSKRKYAIGALGSLVALSMAACVAMVAIAFVAFTPVGLIIASALTVVFMLATLVIAVRYRNDFNSVKPIPELNRVRAMHMQPKRHMVTKPQLAPQLSAATKTLVDPATLIKGRLFQPSSTNDSEMKSNLPPPTMRHR